MNLYLAVMNITPSNSSIRLFTLAVEEWSMYQHVSSHLCVLRGVWFLWNLNSHLPTVSLCASICFHRTTFLIVFFLFVCFFNLLCIFAIVYLSSSTTFIQVMVLLLLWHLVGQVIQRYFQENTNKVLKHIPASTPWILTQEVSKKAIVRFVMILTVSRFDCQDVSNYR